MLFLSPQVHFFHCLRDNGEKSVINKKNVFYSTECLIDAVKLLAEVSVWFLRNAII